MGDWREAYKLRNYTQTRFRVFQGFEPVRVVVKDLIIERGGGI